MGSERGNSMEVFDALLEALHLPGTWTLGMEAWLVGKLWSSSCVSGRLTMVSGGSRSLLSILVGWATLVYYMLIQTLIKLKYKVIKSIEIFLSIYYKPLI